MALSQLQGLSPLGGQGPASAGQPAAPNNDGTSPTDPDQQRRKRQLQQQQQQQPTPGGQSVQPQTFSQMQQAGQARPAPPAPAPTTAAPQAQFPPASLRSPQATTQNAPVVSDPTNPGTGGTPQPPRQLAPPPPSDTNPAGQIGPSQTPTFPNGPTGPLPPTGPGVTPPTTPGTPTYPGGPTLSPTASQSTVPSALSNALVSSVTGQLANPSSFNQPVVQQDINALNQNLAVQDTLGKQSIDQTMAERGLYDSSLTGDQYGQLENSEAAQRAQLAATLGTEAAQTYGTDVAAAQNAGTGLAGTLSGANLGQQAQDLATAMGYANATGSINGNPTLANTLGSGQINASLLNAERGTIGNIATAGLLSNSPTAPSGDFLNFLTGGQIGGSGGSNQPPLAPAVNGTATNNDILPGGTGGGTTLPSGGQAPPGTPPGSPSGPGAPNLSLPNATQTPGQSPTATSLMNAMGYGSPAYNNNAQIPTTSYSQGAPQTQTNQFGTFLNPNMDQLAARGYGATAPITGNTGNVLSASASAPGTAYLTVNGQQMRIMGTSAAGGAQPKPGQDYYWLQGPNGQMQRGPVIGSEYQQFMQQFNG